MVGRQGENVEERAVGSITRLDIAETLAPLNHRRFGWLPNRAAVIATHIIFLAVLILANDGPFALDATAACEPSVR